jgi:PAS domain S-box-containing protein
MASRSVFTLSPRRIALGYAVIASLWIAFSDALAKKAQLPAALLTLKGIAFVGVTALLLYLMIQRLVNAVRSERARWQGVVEGIAEEVWVCDAQGKMTLINLPAVTAMGLETFEHKSVEEVLEEVDILHLDGQPRPAEQAPLLRSLRGEVVRGEEIMRHRRTGTTRYRQFSSAPMRDAAGAITGAVAIVRDITDHKKAEQQLQKVNRTLRAINDSNQTLLHATDETTLLHDVCRIITEDCGYQLVWIGFAEQNEEKSVRPVAHAGFDEGYLNGLQITWSDTERGRGPTGTAIRTGQACMCRNMVTESQFQPWREEALKRGYASSLVLPLIADGKAFGAINIYSKQADAFSSEEVELLAELAGDLAYGVTALRLRTAHAQADKALRESEQQFRTLANAIPQLCWIANADGWIFWYNERWYAYTGSTPEQMEGWGWQSVHDPQMLPDVLERWKASIATGEPLDMVFPLRGADGAFHPFLTRVMPVKDAKGKVVRWFGTNTDITERKEAEQQLAANLDAMTRLQKLGTLFVREGNLGPVLGEIVEAAIAIAGSDFGNIQLLDAESAKLRIAAQRGFPQWWIDFWNNGSSGVGACGRALERGERVIVEDVEQSPVFVGTPALEIQLKAGVRAVQSTPLVSRSGKLLGIFSTHYKMPYRPDQRSLRLLDLLARQAADLIEHAQAQEAIRAKEAELEIILYQTPFMLNRCSRDLRYTYVSRAYAQMIGRTPDQVAGQPIVEIMGEEGFQTIRPHMEAVLQGRPVEYETGVHFQGVGLRRLKVVYVPDEDEHGEIIGWVASILDVTEQHQAEEALLESGQRLAAVVDSAMDAIITLDQEQRIVMFNAAAERTFGCPAAEVIGQPLDQFIPEQFREIHRSHIRQFGETGVTSRSMQSPATLYGRRADGREFPIEATISQVEAGGQKLYTVILRDITQRKQTEEILMRSEKLTTVGRLAATIAHEINNPLSAVTNMLFLLKGDQSIAPASRQYLELAEVELQRAGQIANTTLGLSKQAAAPAKFRPVELLDGVLALVSRKLEGKGVKIEKAYHTDGLEITGVAGEIRQVLWNLVSNAVEAIPEQGRILVRVCGSADWRRTDIRGARFTIADTGCGMTREALQHIFEPFFTTKHTGTGLGLWVTSEIVRKHGGSIKVRSRDGETQHGTVFSIFLPADGQHVSRSATTSDNTAVRRAV